MCGDEDCAHGLSQELSTRVRMAEEEAAVLTESTDTALCGVRRPMGDRVTVNELGDTKAVVESRSAATNMSHEVRLGCSVQLLVAP